MIRSFPYTTSFPNTAMEQAKDDKSCAPSDADFLLSILCCQSFESGELGSWKTKVKQMKPRKCTNEQASCYRLGVLNSAPCGETRERIFVPALPSRSLDVTRKK